MRPAHATPSCSSLATHTSTRDRQMVIFETRLFDLAQRVQSVPLTHNSVPLPLLHAHESSGLTFIKPSRRKYSIHFSGSCTNPLRQAIPDWLAAIDDARAHKCDEKLDQGRWQDEVASSNFTLVPSGTYPSTFMIFEALRLGVARLNAASPSCHTHEASLLCRLDSGGALLDLHVRIPSPLPQRIQVHWQLQRPEQQPSGLRGDVDESNSRRAPRMDHGPRRPRCLALWHSQSPDRRRH